MPDHLPRPVMSRSDWRSVVYRWLAQWSPAAAELGVAAIAERVRLEAPRQDLDTRRKQARRTLSSTTPVTRAS